MESIYTRSVSSKWTRLAAVALAFGIFAVLGSGPLQAQGVGGTEICCDNEDNDGDGWIDCYDPDCYYDPCCPISYPPVYVETSCTNGIDDDGDGHIDCADEDCTPGDDQSFWCEKCRDELCCDEIDNDCDGLIDCADTDCEANDFCIPEICDDSIDNDCDELVDCADPDCIDAPNCFTGCIACVDGEICWDGADNDDDGWVDCYDPDCYYDPCCPIGLYKESNCTDGIDNDYDGYTDCLDPDCYSCCACAPEGSTNPDGSPLGCVVDPFCHPCNDGFDNDRDGLVDCLDPDCIGLGFPACGPVELCNNAFDDDGDGLQDCADPDCALNAACNPETDCGDNIDNDFDGFIDTADCDCGPNAPENNFETSCIDTIDNDCDGLTDCEDPDCVDQALHEEICADGLDNDCDGNIDCDDSECATFPGCDCSGTTPVAENCTNGQDDDGDTLVDCDDPDCAAHPTCQPVTGNCCDTNSCGAWTLTIPDMAIDYTAGGATTFNVPVLVSTATPGTIRGFQIAVTFPSGSVTLDDALGTDVEYGADLQAINGGTGPNTTFLLLADANAPEVGSVFGNPVAVDVPIGNDNVTLFMLHFSVDTSTTGNFTVDFGLGPDSIVTECNAAGDAAMNLNGGTFTFTETTLNFVRGDVNGSGSININDPILLLSVIFQGGSAECVAACDTNGSGSVNISDAIFLLGHLFVPGSPSPAAPFPSCGLSFTGDPLDCDEFNSCP